MKALGFANRQSDQLTSQTYLSLILWIRYLTNKDPGNADRQTDLRIDTLEE
jgi:hypothetical protein